MNAFIAFELNDATRLNEVKTLLYTLAYHNAWLSDKGLRYNLPQNCVWKPSIELEAAVRDIQSVIANLNVQHPGIDLKLVNCIALSNTPWFGIPAP